MAKAKVEYDDRKVEEKRINRKRKAIDCEDKTIYSLPDDLLKNCLSYVGDGNFFFVGQVSRLFHKCYISLYRNQKTRADGSGSDYLRCAKMCICFGPDSSNFEESLFDMLQ